MLTKKRQLFEEDIAILARQAHLLTRAKEFLDEFHRSSKIGVFKPISCTTEWMDPDYKEDLQVILDEYIKANS